MSGTGFPEGFAIVHAGQLYRPIGTREFVNTKGQRVMCIDWRSVCPECGEAFTLTTGRRWQRPHARRCPGCRAPGQAVQDARIGQR
jgi:hypothetical protein